MVNIPSRMKIHRHLFVETSVDDQRSEVCTLHLPLFALSTIHVADSVR
jgi:hypothetical protein